MQLAMVKYELDGHKAWSSSFGAGNWIGELRTVMDLIYSRHG
jgi:hypothetical protein